MSPEVAGQKKAEEKNIKSQNHQVAEENSLVNSVKVLDGVHVHVKAC
jgi:hypothetical protein